MTIQFEGIATQSLRRSPRGDDICKVISASLNGADAGNAIKRHVLRDAECLITSRLNVDLAKFKRVFVLGAGKASVPMAHAIYEILGDRITSGLIITKDGYLDSIKYPNEPRQKVIEASHPIPDQRNLDAATLLVTMTSDLHRDDLVIFLLSGGGSSLLTNPSPGISLKDLQTTTTLLLRSGASINEINTVRKHVEVFKGGGFAKILSPATVLSLIMSDVVGNNLDVIASGPTVGDPTTFDETWAILEKYQILDHIPPHIRSHISAGIAGKIPETVKPGDPILSEVSNIIVGNNFDAAMCAADTAKRLGFNTSLLTTSLQGEASQMGKTLSEEVKALLYPRSKISRPACLIAGGETTVTIKGPGIGGRNQELALGAVRNLSGSEQWILASLATDGGDGPTDAAGAVTTHDTFSRGLAMGLDPQAYLIKNDSYHYFDPLGDLIKTGPTLTNVNDLVFIFGL
ncbi:MAG: hypothetical protein A2Y53_07205 [Chloroflexi bacterium RBG_16_47_49]|nr:MAG: hypothetical protein A2Y53_07205 [Chloroflexi bacterium RBG_16_47_49]